MREYKAFISYRHLPLDNAVAIRLHRLIEHYRVPAELAGRSGIRKLGYVFRDQDELPLSSDLSSSIQEALDHSEFLIVICSPETPHSLWVEREIAYFLQHHDRNHVLAVLADGRPEESFPSQLVNVMDEAGNIVAQTEPLAANIVAATPRQTLRKLNRESLRLIASLIGCPYDALYHRERRYRARRAAIATGAVLAVALGFIGILLVKNRQITLQNQTLIQQKRDIQLSESRLLTGEAQEALADGDPVSAIRNALAALPTDRADDRPFHAPAESVLLDALGVYNLEDAAHSFITGTTLRITAPVHTALATDDGSILLVMDEYGDIYAFDPYAGQPLWEHQIDGRTTAAFSFCRMLLDEAKGCVLVMNGEYINAYALQDGRQLWMKELRRSGWELFELSPDGECLACAETTDMSVSDDSDDLLSTIDLIILEAATGRELHRARLVERSPHLINFRSDDGRTELPSGCFLADNTLFAGYYELDLNQINYFVADLKAGDARVLRTDPIEISIDPLCLLPDAEETAVLVLFEDSNTHIAASFECIDLASGEVTWRAQTPEESEFIDPVSPADCHLLDGGRKLLFSAGSYLYALDKTTGSVMASTSLQAPLKRIFWVDDDGMLFGFVLENGYYAIGWINDTYGLVDSSIMHSTLSLGKNALASVGKRGFLQPAVEGNSIAEIRTGDYSDGMGYVATVPASDERVLQIMHLVRGDEYIEEASIPFPDDHYYLASGKQAILIAEDRAILGQWRYADTRQINGYRVLDTRSHALGELHTFAPDLLDQTYLLSDGSGALILRTGGSVLRWDTDADAPAILAEAQTLVVEGTGERSYSFQDSLAHANYLASDGRLLAAWCDGKRLRWWLDGVEQPEAALPDSLRWRNLEDGRNDALLLVQASGFIVFSQYAGGDGTAMRGFVAYDTASGQWYGIEDAGLGSISRPFSSGSAAPRLAAIDRDGSLRVYDLKSGLLLTRPLGLPVDYTRSVELVDDGRVALVRLADDTLLALSAQTGEELYRGTLKSDVFYEVSLTVDSAGQRGYIIDSSSQDGIVVNLADWTELARLSNALAFNPQTDEMYFRSGDEIIARKIPDLEALLAFAQTIAGQ